MLRLPVPLVAASLLLLALAVAFPAAAQDSVRTRGWGNAERGRIVFDWPRQVPYEAAIQGDTLTVRFGEPMRTDITAALSYLKDYVTAGSVSPDGRAARFELTQPFELSSFRSGPSVVVDLKAKAAAAAPQAELGVRVGTHPNYERLVFDWTRNVDYTVQREGDVLSVRFSAPARIDAQTLAQDLPDGIAVAGQPAAADGGTSLSLRIPADTRVRHFRLGTRVVVDLLKGREEATQAAAPPQQAAPPAIAPAPRARPEPAPVAAEPAAPATPATPAAKPDTAAVAAALRAAQPPAGQTAASTPQAAAEPAPAGTPAQTPPTQTPPTQTPPTQTPPTQTPAAEAPAADAATPATPAPQTAQAGADPAPVTLEFAWPEEVGAAVFRRDNYVWIVFDRRTPLELAPMRAATRDIVDRMEQLPVANGTVVRLHLTAPVSPIASRNSNNWIVTFRKGNIESAISIASEVDLSGPEGAQLVFPVAETGEIIRIPDPAVGDLIDVIALKGPGHGVPDGRRMPEFEVLPSAQGIALVPFDDSLSISKTPRVGVVVTTEGGLHVTPVAIEGKTDTANKALGARLFDPEAWQHKEMGSFYDAKQQLFLNVTEASPENRNEKRMDLARLYFSYGMGQETLGLLKYMESMDSRVADKLEFRALRAASLILAERYEEGGAIFSDPQFDRFREAQLWRGAALAGQEDWREASRRFQFGDPVLRSYPVELKAPIGLLRGIAGMESFDMASATVWFDLLEGHGEAVPPGIRDLVKFHEGRLARSSRNVDRAVQLWEEVKRGHNRAAAVQAEYNLIDLGLQQQTMTEEQAIERLERLRFDWRGDEFELKVLRRLADLYFDRNDYRHGFQMLRVALANFGDHPAAAEITQRLTDAFKRLYLEGEADKLPPLTALALYEEFRELTPVGPEGDEMIQKLADRLIGVELLDRAAELLEHQIRFRLEGEEKARIGMKLAVVKLLNEDPGGAIKALRDSFMANLPPDLEDDRRRIRAKATYELGQPNEAIALLAGDTSRDADLLRADIFWRERNWNEVAKVLQRLSGEPPDEETQYNQRQAEIVLNWAVALRLAKDEPGLEMVREFYGPAMAKSPLADAFRFIASPASATTVEAESLTRQISEIEDFQAFLTNYRERLIKAPAPPESGTSGGAPPSADAPGDSGTGAASAPPTPSG